MSLDEVCNAIIELLPLSENNLGFVSPTHFVLQMISIVEELRLRGFFPTIVYNTNGYELPETIRSLEGLVDVWLPDFKYSDDDLAMALSEAPRYSHFALKALKEMVRQVGTSLLTDINGITRRGIIIRHLVLPGLVNNSIGVLKLISDNLSPDLHLSLMSQYYPTDKMRTENLKSQISDLNLQPSRKLNPAHEVSARKSLDRTITREEYEAVVSSFNDLGFTRGWLQEYGSHQTYRPDFSRENPFG